GAPLELVLVERNRPAETALVRGHARVVFDAADDEAPFDAEQGERRHPDQLHSLWLQRREERVPELERTLAVDPELVSELGGVAETRHEDWDTRDLDVLAKTVVREGIVREVLVCERLQHLPAPRSLQAEVRHLVRELTDADLGPSGASGEDLVVAVVGTAEPDVVARLVPAHDRAVVDHLAVVVAQRSVRDLSGLELRDVARDHPVHEVECPRAIEIHLAQHREVHQPRRLSHCAVLLECVRHAGRRPVAEQIHPVVRQRLQPRIESRLLAHACSSFPFRASSATGSDSSSDSQTSSVSSRSSISPWWPEVLIASSYIVTSFGQQTTK